MITEYLYFIALIPPQPLKNEVQQIKEEFANTYNVYHALKSPPHITLIPPFKMHEQEISRLSEFLIHFASECSPFNLSLENYAAFKPRVIFIKPILNKNLSELFDGLNERFYESFPVGERSSRLFHPHLTIAFRDLKPNIFNRAWQDFKSKKFYASFSVDRVFLLKHNGKRWEEFKEYTFERI